MHHKNGVSRNISQVESCFFKVSSDMYNSVSKAYFFKIQRPKDPCIHKSLVPYLTETNASILVTSLSAHVKISLSCYILRRNRSGAQEISPSF